MTSPWRRTPSLMRAGLAAAIDFVPSAGAGMCAVAAAILIHRALNGGGILAAATAPLLATFARGFWRADPRVMRLASGLCALSIPIYLVVERNPFAYLHYEHRWDPDGPERYARMIWTTVGALALLSILFAVSAHREAKRRLVTAPNRH